VDFKIVWTLRSREDLRDIAIFIAKDNPPAAISLGELLFERADRLKKFPEFGRIVPERNQARIREIIVKNYRVIYRVRPDEKLVEILRVWHGARGEPEI
jgi:toxin ParE1/3/4